MGCVIHIGDTRVFARLGHLKKCACPYVSTTNTDKLNRTASHGHLGLRGYRVLEAQIC